MQDRGTRACYGVGRLPGYATPILYARGIVLKTALRMAFVEIKMIKKLGEDQIK